MKNTWASGAIELLKHAESHLKLETAFDKRIAFISIDNSVETAIRTFISLPPGKSGVKFPRKEVEEAGNSFPKLVSLVFKYAPDRIIGLDDGDIEHYHRIRNQLYHNGTGLSVDESYLKAYRQISYVLLQNLFGIKLAALPSKPSLEKLILLWNQIESFLKSKFAALGIDGTYKWELAVKAGILDMNLVKDITELRGIRNQQAHSTTNELDMARISLGVQLGEHILKKLEDQKQVD